MSGYLELNDGGWIAVRDGMTIGRVATCDIALDDTKVSRRHARLIVDRGVVEIEDLRSSNGTLLNGKPIERRMLRDGDVISVGKSELVFRAAREPAPAPASPAPAPDAPAAAPPPATSETGDLLAGDLLDDDDFVDVPIAPPQVDAAAAPPPTPVPPAPKPARKPAPRPRAAPEPVRPEPAAAKPGADATPSRDRGVLQFSRRRSSGALFDDVGQTAGSQRLLIVLGGIVVAIAAAFAALQLVS